MILSLNKSELKDYVSSQLVNLFPDKYCFDGSDIDSALDLALQKMDFCFKHINSKRYFDGQQSIFSHLHSDQYLMFIYFLSNSLYEISKNYPICNKLFSLNKALNSICIMYDLNMPKIFLIFHGTGSVIGKAEYGEFFFSFQNVTIGAHMGKYPKIGRGVSMFANSTIIGDCNIGDFCSIGAGTSIYQRNIVNKNVVYTDKFSNAIVSKSILIPSAQEFFNVDILNYRVR